MHADETGSAARAVGAPLTGSLTFLFTDVEGSTPLWERHEAAMRGVAARHDALLDAIISAHQGRRVRERGEGDSVFATFASPADAVAAALAMARVVQTEPWPAATPIRIRIGLHTGLAQFREGDYYGPAVNRCARIRGLGHGGQILLSAATAILVRDALPVGAYLRALGRHSLKGLAEPEEVCQLCHADLPGEFPPLLSPQAPKHNLPRALTSLIGREAEQGEVLALLAEARLVTLTGTGGVGKTRLALAEAAELVDQYADGVWLVELAPLADPTLVVGAVAQALRLREVPGRPILATLTDYLTHKQLLLLLDNCEHLLAACADLASALLRAAPGLHILATSRAGLGVTGEQHYRVPSLRVPDSRHLPPMELVGGYEAVRLFVARAQARRRDFALDDGNARAVAAVCARLDGIPLAIELAAARVGSLPVEAIAERLDQGMRLLTGGPRDAPSRQQTLRAALDWSWGLLGEQERLLLRRLSVFAGGWAVETAETVCAGDGIEGWAILDLLDALVNKSLAHLEETAAAARYRLLETVRQYAGERLAVSGEEASVRERHLAWCVALAEAAAPQLTGAEQGRWLVRLEVEHDDLRAALGWARERGTGEAGLRLAGLLGRFWYIRGHLSEGRGWLEAALAGGAQGSPATRSAALNGAGILASQQGEYGRAAALHGEALALQRELGDRYGIASALDNLGGVAERQGEYGRAGALQEEALALRRELGDVQGIASSHNDLGLVAYRRGDYGRASALLEKALALERALGDKRCMAISLHRLGLVAHRQGDYGRATALHEEALALRRALGDRRGIANSLNDLGRAAYRQGDYGRATALLAEGLQVSRDIGARDVLPDVLENLARVAGADGQAHRAARLCGAAEVQREALGVPLPTEQRADHDRAVPAIHAALGEEAFAAAWAEGRALALEAAIALALEGSTAG